MQKKIFNLINLFKLEIEQIKTFNFSSNNIKKFN